MVKIITVFSILSLINKRIHAQDVASIANSVASSLSSAGSSGSSPSQNQPQANNADQQQQQTTQPNQSQSQAPAPAQTAQQGLINGNTQQANNVLSGPQTQTVSDQSSECPQTCLLQMRGDGWCNTECALEKCQNDNGDCDGWCAPDCKKDWIGDKWCDHDCFRVECQWDGGDCDSTLKHGDIVFPPSPHEDFDYSSCDCRKGLLHNGKCDASCNTKECNWDGNDCRHFCAPGCVSAWQGDGECDSACFNEACGYDKGDCGECSPGCRPDRIGNGICDGDCMTDACHWDMGDCAGVCKVYPVDYNELPFEYNQCRTEWEGDGYCDCFCMNEECDYDKGDCKGKESECADKIAAAQSRRGGIYPTPIPGSAQDLARRQSTTTTTTTPLLIGSRDQGSVEVPTASSSDTSVAALLASDAVSE